MHKNKAAVSEDYGNISKNKETRGKDEDETRGGGGCERDRRTDARKERDFSFFLAVKQKQSK